MILIPYKDENPARRLPLVTVLLILANVSVFLYQMSMGPTGNEAYTLKMGVIPFEITRLVDAISPTPMPLLLTLITTMFLHGGWLHIGGNMLYLWIFGNNIEDLLGHVRFLFFYLLCGVVATLAHIASAPDSRAPLIGASGAIAGVLGAYLISFPHARIRVFFWFLFLVRILRVPAFVVLGFWFVVQILNASEDPTTGGVAWFAHIGGFIAGILLVTPYRSRSNRDFVTVYRF